VTWVKWKLISVSLEIMLISTQYRCTVCTEHAIGSEIILGAPDGTPIDVGQVEARFGLFGDSLILVQNRCMVWDERTIGSEIILDTDGTPR
jgi:hypothetical protein